MKILEEILEETKRIKNTEQKYWRLKKCIDFLYILKQKEERIESIYEAFLKEFMNMKYNKK